MNDTGRFVAPAMALFFYGGASVAAAIEIPAGTPIELRLEHHVTSRYVPAGAPLYFRVQGNVTVEGRTVIAAGTLATGEMFDATERGMVGKSGTMSLGVRIVPAVDGTQVPIAADLSDQGRGRGWATLGWTVFWGLPGLITKGVNPYLEKGAILEGRTLVSVMIDPDQVVASPSTQPNIPGADAASSLLIAGHEFHPRAKSPYRFDIERSRKLGVVKFNLKQPSDDETIGWFDPLELVSVNGAPVPIPERAVSTDGTSFTFELWPILQFCTDGANDLQFAAHSPDGRLWVGQHTFDVKIVKKKQKQKDPEVQPPQTPG